ncbi:MAG: nucleotide exchange factor GrpE, partial [Rhodospirillales bacterium]|nr:nucleotide exchange factor GrpE [Rhodospirillales bacterium]
RRLEQQAEDRGKYAVSNFAKDMLQVADNLHRAIEAVPAESREKDEAIKSLITGVEMTERSLLSSFERYGIQPVAALGERFDPHVHQAMMEVEDPSKPSGTVVLVMQGGYMIQDRLLRPAMVGVSKGGPKPEPKVDTSV